MNQRTRLILTAMPVLCLAVASIEHAVAQQKQQVSFKVPAANSKYTQQLTVDVKDMLGHVVRVFGIHYTFTNNSPVVNGLKLVESWDRGFGDRIDGSGSLTLYSEYVMENGDRFFTRSIGVVQNTGGKLSSTTTGIITGGTGKFATIQGDVRGGAAFDYKTGVSEPQTDIEYSIGK